jgi:peptidoglycan/LPS O-acetylase OafA/YrhL
MELILAVLAAGPIGYFAGTRRKGLTIYLIAWAVVFAIQSIVVVPDETGDPLYWVFNALILGLGIGLSLAGSKVRERRSGGAAEVATAEASS